MFQNKQWSVYRYIPNDNGDIINWRVLTSSTHMGVRMALSNDLKRYKLYEQFPTLAIESLSKNVDISWKFCAWARGLKELYRALLLFDIMLLYSDQQPHITHLSNM